MWAAAKLVPNPTLLRALSRRCDSARLPQRQVVAGQAWLRLASSLAPANRVIQQVKERFAAQPLCGSRELAPLPSSLMVRQAVAAACEARNGGVAWMLYHHLQQAGVPLESSSAAKLGTAMLFVNEESNGEQAARRVLALVNSYSDLCEPLRSVGCAASAFLGHPDAVVELIRGRPEHGRVPDTLHMQLLRAYGVAGRLDDAFATFDHLCNGGDVLQAPPVLAATSSRRARGGPSQHLSNKRRNAEAATREATREATGGAHAAGRSDASGRAPAKAAVRRRTKLCEALVEVCVATGDPWRGLRALKEWVLPPQLTKPQLTSAVLARLLKGFVAEARRDRRVVGRVDEVLALASQFNVPIHSAAVSAFGSAGGFLTPYGLRALDGARSSGALVSRAAELRLLAACLDARELGDAEWVAGAASPAGLGHALEVVGALSRKLKHDARQREIGTRASRHLGAVEEEGWDEGETREEVWPEEEEYWARMRDEGPGQWREGPGEGLTSADGAPPGPVPPGGVELDDGLRVGSAGAAQAAASSEASG